MFVNLKDDVYLPRGFDHVQLSEVQRAAVDAQLSYLEDTYELFDEREDFHKIITVFVSQCSPRAPTDESLRLLTHFLYMTLYLNEYRNRSHEPGDRLRGRSICERIISYYETFTSAIRDPQWPRVWLRGLRGLGAPGVDAPEAPGRAHRRGDPRGSSSASGGSSALHEACQQLDALQVKLYDVAPDELARKLHEVHRFFNSAPGSTLDSSRMEADPLVQAATALGIQLRAIIAQEGVDAAPFLHYLRLNLASFYADAVGSRTFDDGAERSARHVELDYSARRLHSISALGYFQFWKVVFFTKSKSRFELKWGAEIAECERRSARIQALANDILSFERDKKKNTPNIIRYLPGDADQSMARVLERHDEMVERLAHASGEIIERAARERASSAERLDLAGYLHFLKSCAMGNFTSMTILAGERYDAS